MSFEAGTLNRFFNSELWRDIVKMLKEELEGTQSKLLTETEPILIGKLQGRVETLRNMVNLHKKYISEEEAADLLAQLDRMAQESSLVAPFTPFEELAETAAEE